MVPIYLGKFRGGILREIISLSVCVLWVALDTWYYLCVYQGHPASRIALKILSSAVLKTESPKARQPSKLLLYTAWSNVEQGTA